MKLRLGRCLNILLIYVGALKTQVQHFVGENERAVWLSVHNFELLCGVDMNLGWFIGAGCFYWFIGL